jgi:hypothetical protein
MNHRRDFARILTWGSIYKCREIPCLDFSFPRRTLSVNLHASRSVPPLTHPAKRTNSKGLSFSLNFSWPILAYMSSGASIGIHFGSVTIVGELSAMSSSNSQNQSVKKLKNILPCEVERKASLSCLASGPREECQVQFDQYRACMREWRASEREARMARRR